MIPSVLFLLGWAASAVETPEVATPRTRMALVSKVERSALPRKTDRSTTVIRRSRSAR
jgi:hypothetical protein